MMRIKIDRAALLIGAAILLLGLWVLLQPIGAAAQTPRPTMEPTEPRPTVPPLPTTEPAATEMPTPVSTQGTALPEEPSATAIPTMAGTAATPTIPPILPSAGKAPAPMLPLLGIGLLLLGVLLLLRQERERPGSS